MMDAFMGFDPRRAARFAGLGALVLFLCWQHVQATRVGYQVESSRRRARAARGRVAELRLRLDETLSPAALAARAGALGMVVASPESLRALPERAASGPRPERLWARVASSWSPARS